MKLGKHIFSVGIMTGISRILGFFRDILIARFLGAGYLSDIFFAAFKIPNMFRDLFGEGALSSIFVPMYIKGGKKKSFANNIFSWLMLILLIITIVFQIFMPFVIWALAPGFEDQAAKMATTIIMARIMFFYVIFVCGTALLSGILNAFSRFALAAFMPAMFNIFLIFGLLVGHYLFDGYILYALSTAVVIAGFIQLMVLWIRIRRNYFGLKLIKPKWNREIKTVLKRLGVGIIGSGFYQITIIIGTLVASFQNGAVSWLYYSDRIIQLPFAIIGLAAGTVLLSTISDSIAKNNMRGVYIQQNSSLRRSMMFIIPATIGLFILATPIIEYLFEYGKWTHESTIAVANAIMIQVWVLPAMTINQIFTKTLYAAHDIKTPVKTSIISLAIASIIYVALFPIIGYLAIPIGVVSGGYLRTIMFAIICRNKQLFKLEKRTVVTITSFVILCAFLGYALQLFAVNNIFELFISIAIFGAMYLPFAFIADKTIHKISIFK